MLVPWSPVFGTLPTPQTSSSLDGPAIETSPAGWEPWGPKTARGQAFACFSGLRGDDGDGVARGTASWEGPRYAPSAARKAATATNAVITNLQCVFRAPAIGVL